MRKIALTVCLLALAPLVSGNAVPRQTPDGSLRPTGLPEPMNSFSFLSGTWIPDRTTPGKGTEEYSFTPILGGRFLSSEEILRDEKGAIVYRDFAVYGADPVTGRLFFHAYNTDGSMDRSAEAGGSKAGAWVFAGTVYGSPRFKDYRYSITRIDLSHMRVLVELKTEGGYAKHSDTLYKRKV